MLPLIDTDSRLSDVHTCQEVLLRVMLIEISALRFPLLNQSISDVSTRTVQSTGG